MIDVVPGSTVSFPCDLGQVTELPSWFSFITQDKSSERTASVFSSSPHSVGLPVLNTHHSRSFCILLHPDLCLWKPV